jgi:hypothetical protein
MSPFNWDQLNDNVYAQKEADIKSYSAVRHLWRTAL